MMAALPGNASGITGLAGDKLAQFRRIQERHPAARGDRLPGGQDDDRHGPALLPEMHTALIGEIERIDVERLTALMEAKKDDTLLVSLLKALLLAKKVHGRVESTLKGVTLHITLGVPPSVNVELS